MAVQKPPSKDDLILTGGCCGFIICGLLGIGFGFVNGGFLQGIGLGILCSVVGGIVCGALAAKYL